MDTRIAFIFECCKYYYYQQWLIKYPFGLQLSLLLCIHPEAELYTYTYTYTYARCLWFCSTEPLPASFMLSSRAQYSNFPKSLTTLSSLLLLSELSQRGYFITVWVSMSLMPFAGNDLFVCWLVISTPSRGECLSHLPNFKLEQLIFKKYFKFVLPIKMWRNNSTDWEKMKNHILKWLIYAICHCTWQSPPSDFRSRLWEFYPAFYADISLWG